MDNHPFSTRQKALLALLVAVPITIFVAYLNWNPRTGAAMIGEQAFFPVPALISIASHTWRGLFAIFAAFQVALYTYWLTAGWIKTSFSRRCFKLIVFHIAAVVLSALLADSVFR